MSRITLPLTAASAAAIAAFALAGASAAGDEPEDWQKVEVAGEAESCIPLRNIRRTEVHDDRTIDFHMTGGRIYRSTLPTRCPSLGFEESFSYETSLSRLCSSDIITVLRQPIGRGLEGPRCGLGEFVPIEYPQE